MINSRSMEKKNHKNAHNFELTLQDIFLLLGAQERTGELIIEAGNNIGTIFIHRRKILQAFSPYSRAIGDLLVENGMISESDLIETLKDLAACVMREIELGTRLREAEGVARRAETRQPSG